MPQSGPTSAYKLHTTNQSDRSTKEFLKQAKQFPSRTLINSKSLSRVHLHPPPPEGEHRLFRAQKSFGRYGIDRRSDISPGGQRAKKAHFPPLSGELFLRCVWKSIAGHDNDCEGGRRKGEFIGLTMAEADGRVHTRTHLYATCTCTGFSRLATPGPI